MALTGLWRTAVVADDANGFSLFDLEGNILQSGELAVKARLAKCERLLDHIADVDEVVRIPHP